MRPFVALLFVVSMAGCSGDSGPALYPANGTVTYNGEPVPNATITFVPENGPIATGTSDAQGRFSLRTGGEEGAAAGNYRVAVIAVESQATRDVEIGGEEYEKLQAGKGPKEEWLIPEKYGTVQGSGLTQEIVEGENQISLELKD